MNTKLFGIFFFLVLCTISPARGQTYIEPKMPIDSLDIALDKDGCMSIIVEYESDILCFFTEDGQQYNPSGYVGFRPGTKMRDVSFCNNSAFIYDPASKTLSLGGRVIKQWAYRARGRR